MVIMAGSGNWVRHARITQNNRTTQEARKLMTTKELKMVEDRRLRVLGYIDTYREENEVSEEDEQLISDWMMVNSWVSTGGKL